MKQKILDELKTKIVKYVPDIMELKRYCRIEMETFDFSGESLDIENTLEIGTLLGVFYTPSEDYYLIIDNDRNVIKAEIDDDFYITNSYKEHRVKILGRPITLEDVLTVVMQTNPSSIRDEKKIEVMQLWWIGKPLHEQELETLEFLNEIL